MNAIQIPFRLRLKVAKNAILHVLSKPAYLCISASLALLVSGVILWSLNFSVLGYVLFDSNSTILEKLTFAASVYQLFFGLVDGVQSIGIIIFSVLFGVNIALLLYAIKDQGARNVPKKSNGAALGLAVLSGGCIACGTSILGPLLLTAGSASSLFLQEVVALTVWLGSIFTLYSIYKLAVIIPVKHFK